MTASTPTLPAVLAARDDRALRQAELHRRSGEPVVSLTIVSPGPVKQSPAIERLFGLAAKSIAVELAQHGWTAPGRVELHTATGPELQLAVAAPAEKLKLAMVRLEDGHPWGRLWDIDVVLPNGPLSREQLGLPRRRCLICREDAASCSRSRKHGLEQVTAAVSKTLARPTSRQNTLRLPQGAKRYKAIGALAAEALRIEARLSPKPGLVDALNAGAHPDMNLRQLLASADALEPQFSQMAELGAQPRWSVDQLQNLGKTAEHAMLAATGGVNTHKGAIFALGWLCALTGNAQSTDEPQPTQTHSNDVAAKPNWRLRIQSLLKPVSSQWLAATGLTTTPTHGQQAQLQYGIQGAMGEAASGFASVVDEGLPNYQRALEQGWAPDDALLSALVALMSTVNDTNLVSRGGLVALRTVQAWAQKLHTANPTADGLRAALTAADPEFSAAGWSPGGSADLVAATWLLHQLNKAKALTNDNPATTHPVAQ
ncbi:MAG: citrate lyase holo-[acyl-carrier protein] synthase [Propionibacteriaceae bacterium]|jgi:holo-ACP synthase/triphosphoribosyl-dephospho-CoA synthase|nr:citrate lyase holo-[acyl-carrier protein] synthase [Propionibacteriaceae bacterium]